MDDFGNILQANRLIVFTLDDYLGPDLTDKDREVAKK